MAAAAALLLLVAVVATLAWVNRSPRSLPSRPGPSVPLTTYHGREQQPTLSPDGNSVAFTWNGEAEDNWDIWVTLIGGGTPLRLTSDPAMDLGPAWSPDGRSIAFVRVRGDQQTVLVVPALGGPEREVVEMKTGALGMVRTCHGRPIVDCSCWPHRHRPTLASRSSRSTSPPVRQGPS